MMVLSGSWVSDAAEIDKEAADNQTAAAEMKRVRTIGRMKPVLRKFRCKDGGSFATVTIFYKLASRRPVRASKFCFDRVKQFDALS